MRLLQSLSLLALLSSASAQYFSQGWDPSKPIPTSSYGQAKKAAHARSEEGAADAATADIEPLTPSKIMSYFDTEKLLRTDVAKSLFSQVGINITERLDATQGAPWDERIQLITDDNYENVIVNEQLTEEEEKERVWCIVITTSTAKHDAISKFVDEHFDAAYNETLLAGDLSHVQWGRIDYMNVTLLTTKWNVWSGPWIVIASDRGQSLRFYRAGVMHMRNGGLRKNLLEKAYENFPVWRSSFGPGGNYEFVMDYLGQAMLQLHKVLSIVPRWMMFVLSGTIASLFMQLLHRGDSDKPKPKAPEAAVADPTPVLAAAPEAKTTPSKPNKSNAKQRKNKK
ncbi:hypothetical protein BD626DRAFT_479909 [Schizophyllum amplum]|uniref:Thioredoxin-like protein n=1 Tax=Schizophyllum amplum TaxID=97359 RepID=A0A550CSQ9_9AGAR|nr:hypothetical protein BD626DRAFT_479909 [Auriculariopsis ampla]